MITLADLTPDREFTDEYGDVRRIIKVANGLVDYVYCEKGKSPSFRSTWAVWKFLQYINGRNHE